MRVTVPFLLLYGTVFTACGGEDAPATPAEGDAAEAPAAEGEETSFEDQVAASTPLDPKPAAQTVGKLEIAAEVCSIEGVSFLHDSNMSLFSSVVATGGRVFIADADGNVRAFRTEDGPGCTLSVDSQFGNAGVLTLEHEIDWLSVADTGRVVASNGVFDSYVIEDGALAYTCEVNGRHEIHASGDWGIAHFSNSTVDIVSYGKDGCTGEAWSLVDLGQADKRKGDFDSVYTAGSFGGDMLVGGGRAEEVDPEKTKVVAVMDRAGKETRRFGGSTESSSDENFGWIHALEACDPGVCALDSNYRRMTIWDADGKYVGTLDLKSLLDMSYAWIADFDLSNDGYVYMVAANDREDSDVAEGFIYRVAGLGTAKAVAPGDDAAEDEPASKGKGKGGKGKGKKRRKAGN